MANLASVPSPNLKNRRQELKSQRRMKFGQAIWRSLFVGSLAGGLLWAIALPNWAIRSQGQIEVEGNHLLSKAQVRSLLALSYPQSLLKLPTQQLSQRLQSAPPIEQASVTREFLPPKLTVKVRERQPVAIVLLPKPTANQANFQLVQAGFLDEQGTFIPKSFYTHLKQVKQPIVKVIGSVESYHPYWPELYQSIDRSTVKIFEVNWQDPNNLILKTELGTAYLGSYTSQIPEQLSILSRMRRLPAYVNASKISYIDLTNPELPSVQVRQEANQKQPPAEKKN